MEDDMGFVEHVLSTVRLTSKELQLELLKGDLKWEDEQIQFFIPIVLNFTDFEWLKLIAEHNCIKEDEIIIKNFLDMVESLKNINEQALQSKMKEVKK